MCIRDRVTPLTATSIPSANWSGVVNTLGTKKYSPTKSFSWVWGKFAVPVPQQAFAGYPNSGNICDGDTDQASFWVGFGGFGGPNLPSLGNQNNVAQTGVDIYASCGFGGTAIGAYAWVEWNPGPAAELFGVNPGDDISVSVQSLSSTTATFFIGDHTLQQTGSYEITAPTGANCPKNPPCVNLGNEAEYIVERPFGDSTPTGFYPLANYGWSFWDFSRAQAFTGVYYYPGGTNPATYDVSMTDDSGKNIISVPYIDKGLQNLFVETEGCAGVNGCTP